MLVVTPLSQPPVQSRHRSVGRGGWSLCRICSSPAYWCWCSACRPHTGCPAAVAGFKFQRLHRCKLPAHFAMDIFVDYPFATRRIGTRIGAGARRFVAGVNVLRIGLWVLLQVAPQVNADGIRNRAVKTEVGAFCRAFFAMLRCVQVSVPGEPCHSFWFGLVMMLTALHRCHNARRPGHGSRRYDQSFPPVPNCCRRGCRDRRASHSVRHYGW